MNKSLLFLVGLFAFFSCKESSNTPIIVVNYNVENLFDTINDPEINDEEFTPDSKKEWNEDRYAKKLSNIAQVLASIDTCKLPAVIGLEEIENRKVLEDLIADSALLAANYQIAHQDSPDKRGIDVALLYNPEVFKYIEFEVLPVALEFPTRDILHVKGEIKGETFHIYVNHWPSRIGGTEETEKYRIVAANALQASIVNESAQDKDANIIILGDMNDEPSNNSISKVLDANTPNSDARLVNLMYEKHLNKEGSYNFRGNWNMLDNMIVSRSLLDKNGLQVVESTGYIHRLPFFEFTNNHGEVSPSRTYGGPNYYGGVSDHFPVYFILK
ncbi:MAG: endonuclease/exonuclease/phosphatase family protein [Mangrovibacterium sp.]